MESKPMLPSSHVAIIITFMTNNYLYSRSRYDWAAWANISNAIDPWDPHARELYNRTFPPGT